VRTPRLAPLRKNWTGCCRSRQGRYEGRAIRTGFDAHSYNPVHGVVARQTHKMPPMGIVRVGFDGPAGRYLRIKEV